MTNEFTLQPIGHIRSPIRDLVDAPRQGFEGAPDAWLDIDPAFERGLHRIEEGDDIIIVSWLHQANRHELETHPRSDPSLPLAGVFSTRSPNRPNPLGLHEVTVKKVEGPRLLVGPLEAIDGTPVVDIKPRI